MFHRATFTAGLVFTLVLLGSAEARADWTGGAHARGTSAAGTTQPFDVYFGPGGKHGRPTAKFFRRERLIVPADWRAALQERTAERNDLRWIPRSELIAPRIHSTVTWDAGLALVGDLSAAERKVHDWSLPLGSRSSGLPAGMDLPRIVRVTVSFPIALTLPQPDPRLDRILLVRSPFPKASSRPRFVPFGGTTKASPRQLAFLQEAFGARAFEGDPGDLRFTLNALHLEPFATWLRGPAGPRDTPRREAREEFGEFHILRPAEIADLFAAQDGRPYRALSPEAIRPRH
ncbi:MAG: hypothetical protein IPL40_00145 [Proteobacteria bacterium]|nr:hypothetical protein [Pseudomonadota bacterium]